MISIRENVFESNSSSMHSLVIATSLNDEKLYIDYITKELERYKTKTGSYHIEVECDDGKVDNGSFDTRAYIPHYSINDKLIYLLAATIQHYFSQMERYWEFDSEEDKKVYIEKNFERNKRLVKDFEHHLKRIQEWLVYKIAEYLNVPKSQIKLDFKYYVDPETNLLNYFAYKKGKYFSTGCYGNEEFFHATYFLADAVEFMLNPYSAILAGSDECSDQEMFDQEQEAIRLITEAFNHSDNTYDSDKCNSCFEDLSDTDQKKLRLNRSKVIWPIGG